MDVKSQTAGLAAQALTSPLEDQDIDKKDKSGKFKLIRYFSTPTCYVHRFDSIFYFQLLISSIYQIYEKVVKIPR